MNIAEFLRSRLFDHRMIDEVFRYEAKIDGEWGCCCSASDIESGQCTKTDVNEIKTLRLMAEEFDDDPDYSEAWRP
ncbi:hypothetical protein [Streptomyces sp. NPDC055085]